MTQGSSELNVAIIGGGPAGISAALWCSELGLTSILFEVEPELGGQLLRIYNAIPNYLGVDARNGRELRDKFIRHMGIANGSQLTGSGITSADLACRTLMSANGQGYAANTIVIATGVRRRMLGIPGETEFRGRGVLESGVREQHDVSGKIVLIVGGGDAALENALLLSKNAAKVYVVHRRRELTARREFIDAAGEQQNIDLFLDKRLLRIGGSDKLEVARISDNETGEHQSLDVDHVLIRAGVVPNTELFNGQIDLNGEGYVLVNGNFETNLDNIYAIGDVANSVGPTISGAAGSGASAVKAIAARKAK